MKLLSKSRIAIAALGLGSLFISATASADYRVTAFGDAVAYQALIAKDVASAKSAFYTADMSKLDFIAANNLCVTQILAKELDAAIESCSLALSKAEADYELSTMSAKSAKASIYSNMAVAKAMSGDMLGASGDLEKALLLNSRDRNAVSNYNLISSTLAVPASDIAQAI
jgi:hypothetical protein